MKILISGATTTLREELRSYVGVLVVPGQRALPASVLWPDCVWAGDNGAFSDFDADAFMKMLRQYRAHRSTCKFITVPDVVADAAATRERFKTWAPAVRSYGYPLAFVAQDGLTLETAPWSQFDALFIGGSTEWKLGETARELAAWAKAIGKWVHMGRVNSVKRLRYAESIGCDSVDGSGFSRFPREMLRVADGWHQQPQMAFE